MGNLKEPSTFLNIYDKQSMLNSINDTNLYAVSPLSLNTVFINLMASKF